MAWPWGYKVPSPAAAVSINQWPIPKIPPPRGDSGKTGAVIIYIYLYMRHIAFWNRISRHGLSMNEFRYGNEMDSGNRRPNAIDQIKDWPVETDIVGLCWIGSSIWIVHSNAILKTICVGIGNLRFYCYLRYWYILNYLSKILLLS